MDSKKTSPGQTRDGGLFARVVRTDPLSGTFANERFTGSVPELHHLLLVEDGRINLTRGQEHAVLFPGSCWLLPPGDPVRFRVAGDRELQGHAVAFEVWTLERLEAEQAPGAVVSSAVGAATFPISGMLDSRQTDEVRRWLEESERTDGASEAYQAFFHSVRFQELLLRIWHLSEQRLHSREIREAIQKTVVNMEQSYAHSITREELARMANMSPSYYSSVFKREIGVSPMEKLTEIRIRQAKKQLLFSGRKLRDIAESVGYRNEFYFSRQFKQLVGVSPNAFARQHYAKHAMISHPFPLHLQSLGLGSYSADGLGDGIKVVGLYVEDFLVSLGVQPVLKCVGNSFRQSYLNAHLNGVAEWSLLSFDFGAIADAKPDLIILGHFAYGDNGRFARFSEIAPTYSIRRGLLHHWEDGLRIIGQLLNRRQQAESLIASHAFRLMQAKARLETIADRTVELIRICNDRHVRLYGGPNGYSGAVLYRDLGLQPSATVQRRAWDKPSGYIAISPEEVFESQADHLFVVVDPAGRPFWNRLVRAPGWSRMPCVRAGHWHEVRFDYWMTFGFIAHRLKVQDVLRFLAPPHTHSQQ